MNLVQHVLDGGLGRGCRALFQVLIYSGAVRVGDDPFRKLICQGLGVEDADC